MLALLRNKIMQYLLIFIASISIGLAIGWFKRGSYDSKIYTNAQLAADKISEIRQQHYLNNLRQVEESSNIQLIKIAKLEENIKNEREKNTKLLNDNNRITKQFVKLYDSSTSTSMQVTPSESGYATEASSIVPNRILGVMQTNNVNCQYYIVQLNKWIDLYELNQKTAGK
jgi:hypothetical protein